MARRDSLKADYTGHVFGAIKVLSFAGRTKGRESRWICQCICGHETDYCIKEIKATISDECKCETKHKRNRPARYNDTSRIPTVCYNTIINIAKRNPYGYHISIEYLQSIYNDQKGKCALTGLDIGFKPMEASGHTASLDRINSNQGYFEGNVQWVHYVVNLMKLNHPQEDFIRWCKLVAEHNPSG